MILSSGALSPVCAEKEEITGLVFECSPEDTGESREVKEGRHRSHLLAEGLNILLPYSPLQFSLLSEVRSIILPQDLDRFDHLVLRREIESMKARQPPAPGAGDTYSMVSYSDTGSSTGSHGTSTTVSSARVSCPCPIPGEKVRAAVKTLAFPYKAPSPSSVRAWLLWSTYCLLDM